MSWIDSFPALQAMSVATRADLVRAGQLMQAPAGARLFSPGDAADRLLLLLSGSVRVQHLSRSGRQLVLYRIAAGETCVMTTACLMAHEHYAAEGIAETDCRAVGVPRPAFDRLMAQSEPFRSFVFAGYARRIAGLFHLIDDLAFQRIDVRLAQRLVALAGPGVVVTATQQQLADELGTAREVVSRQLHEFQRRGWLEVSRGRLFLCDPAALSHIGGQV